MTPGPVTAWVDGHVTAVLVALATLAGYLLGTATPRRKRRR